MKDIVKFTIKTGNRFRTMYGVVCEKKDETKLVILERRFPIYEDGDIVEFRTENSKGETCMVATSSKVFNPQVMVENLTYGTWEIETK